MYLTELNVNERKDFLDLAFYAMGLNGIHKDGEKCVYTAFVHECGLESHEAQSQDDIAKVVHTFSKASIKVKKIVVIEVLGILLADGVICEKETEFLDLLGSRFEMEPYEIRRIQRWVENMNDLVLEGYRMLEVS